MSQEKSGRGSGGSQRSTANENVDGIELSVRSGGLPDTSKAESRPKDGDIVENYAEYGLPLLNYRPLLLQDWVLIASILINVGWIIWLAIAYTRPLWHGPDFILGGLFSGYVATATKFFIIQQAFCIGRIMPYRNMLSPKGGSFQNTIDSDYWPYEWPIPRIRPLRNGDYFYQVVDIVAFVFTSAVVQFESNILQGIYDDDGNVIGYTPNQGIMIIVMVCHGVFVVTTGSILIWLRLRETGLLADTGYLALYLSLFNQKDIKDDFQGRENEDRRWIVRKALKGNKYRIGYWAKCRGKAVYGIRRMKTSQDPPTDTPGNNTDEILRTNMPESETNEIRPTDKPRSNTVYPEFRYVPWFVEPFWVAIWTSVLAASLAILATLVIRDHIIRYGFDPHASTAISPFFKISPAAFLWSFLPSFAAEIFYMLVYSIDTFHRLVQPYADLKRKNASREAIIKCFRINYVNDLPFVVTIRAGINGHTKVALISFFSFFASLTPAFAANMFFVDSDDWMAVWTRYFYPILVYMSLLVVFLLCTIPDQSRYMPRDLETIADHMALFSQSSLLDKGQFQYERPLAKPNVNTKIGRLKRIKSAMAVLISKKALIGPPDLVDDVTNKMEELLKDVRSEAEVQHGQSTLPNGKLPRFGIWADMEKNSYVIGIDSNAEKMVSLFEDDFYKFSFKDFERSWFEQMF